MVEIFLKVLVVLEKREVGVKGKGRCIGVAEWSNNISICRMTDAEYYILDHSYVVGES